MHTTPSIADTPVLAHREPERTPARQRQDTLASQLRAECDVMTRHILRQGLPVPAELIARSAALVDPSQGAGGDAVLAELADIHQKLINVVAPATPQAIGLLDPAALTNQRFALLGPVPLIRMLTVSAIGFLVAVLLMALPAKVSLKNMELGLLDSSGPVLLMNLMFLLFCAGLGASFATLFHAHRYIENATYDPRHDASYSARLILGIIAGLILAEILPEHVFSEEAARSYGKPALAMLGGFSATAVHRLLQRIVDTLDALVRGDSSAQYESSLNSIKAKLSNDLGQSKNEMVAQVLALQQALDANASPDVMRQRLSDLARSMLSPQYRTAAADAGTAEPTR